MKMGAKELRYKMKNDTVFKVSPVPQRSFFAQR